jgi:hypothetical protein
MGQGLAAEANRQCTQAVVLLHKAQEAAPQDNRISLELATTLQKQGDLQRRIGDAQALTTYTTALDLLDKIIADDPTSFTARSTIELTRLGVRLLGAATQADAATAQKRDDVRAGIDRDFGTGIGEFQFGMTVPEVNRRLRSPFGLSSPFDDKALRALPRASEYSTGEVRYFWKKLQDEPNLRPFTLSACLLAGRSEVILMFYEGKLFRFDLRFFPPHPCDERPAAFTFEKFVKQYGLTTIGSDVARRFQYETQNVAVTGESDSSLVHFAFVQR